MAFTSRGIRIPHSGKPNGVSNKQQAAPLYMELSGGLGNQLFMLTAGIFLSKNLGSRLHAYIHESFASEFLFGQGIAALVGRPSHSAPFGPILPGTPKLLKLKWAVHYFLRRLWVDPNLIGKVLKVYKSEEVGEDRNISTIQSGYSVKGYFQTHSYFSALGPDYFAKILALPNPSTWAKELTEKAANLRPLIVHVRRGDYLSEQNESIGALSPAYYLDAIKKLQGQMGLEGREVWIFSNDVPMVREEFGAEIDGVVRWIEPPKGTLDAESLILMGKGSGLIISNSTFSWWAAALGNPEVVIAPSKWFKSAEDPRNLIMPHWNTVESRWL
jgi:hypothetical protein